MNEPYVYTTDDKFNADVYELELARLRESNARLLEALKRIIGNGTRCPRCNALDIAKAAIRAAEGEK